jgi:threonine aldolase
MSDTAIDLRSDTVTQPTAAMRAAMAAAPVGDDQFGEDPTVNLLQERIAETLGKEAALWLPSGTMANQVALRVLTRPGDDVIVSRQCHAVLHETGASGANAGVQFTEIGQAGVFSREEFVTACKPRDHIVLPPTTLIEVENTHNRSGGVVFPHAEAVRVCAEARRRQIATYMDGARLWNAAVASGVSPTEIAAPFDLVSVAFSKGLGAPGGSAMAGSRELIARAVRYRRMFGGAMRQVGIFAAAALYALDHHMNRLADDHVNARRMAEMLADNPRVIINPAAVQANIVVFEVSQEAPDAAAIVSAAREQGLLLFAFGERTLRAVTHMDVSREHCELAATILDRIVGR